MGAHSAELYNNLGLCCLYSQQLDLTLACFQRALDLATDPLIKADVWYNLSYVAIVSTIHLNPKIKHNYSWFHFVNVTKLFKQYWFEKG